MLEMVSQTGASIQDDLSMLIIFLSREKTVRTLSNIVLLECEIDHHKRFLDAIASLELGYESH